MNPQTSRLLAGALLAVAAFAALPPYTGPVFGFVVVTSAAVEFLDHVVPALVVGAVAVPALLSGRLTMTTAIASVLAGTWVTATHAPLLLQARRGGIDTASALWHSVPGIVLLLLAVAVAGAVRSAERRPEREPS